jgi:iron(III) transport system substrate-binding protein
LIGKKAANPNAAKLWIDYLLSRRGQTVLADRANLASLRSDVEGAHSAAAMAASLGPGLRPIALGPDLLAPFSDPARHRAFLTQWQEAIGMRH